MRLPSRLAGSGEQAVSDEGTGRAFCSAHDGVHAAGALVTAFVRRIVLDRAGVVQTLSNVRIVRQLTAIIVELPIDSPISDVRAAV
jgi:hypothetical protein